MPDPISPLARASYDLFNATLLHLVSDHPGHRRIHLYMIVRFRAEAGRGGAARDLQ